MKKIIPFALFLGWILYSNCGYNQTSVEGYNLNKPEKVFKMPGVLKEISGIAMVDDQRIACVEDENGIIYIFNLSTGSVEKEVRFANRGDFEDIVIIGNDAWILESSGTFHLVKNFLTNPETEKIETTLSKKFDSEGACIDKERNRLLIAAKFNVGNADEKSVFEFDLGSRKLNENPVFTISHAKMESYYSNRKKETNEDEKAMLERKNFDRVFAPSGISFNPKTGNLYLLSARNQLLLILDRNGEIKESVLLQGNLFSQPEGILFSPEGTLYISNEGQKKSSGNILKFEPHE